jgi:hypothetical protein
MPIPEHHQDIGVDVEETKELEDEVAGPSIFYQMRAQCIGTMFLVMIGVSAVYSAVQTTGISGTLKLALSSLSASCGEFVFCSQFQGGIGTQQ